MKKFLFLAATLFAAMSIQAQTAVTCAEAKAAMPAEKNATTTETYIVTGYVTNTDGKISREQQVFWMDDAPGTTKTVQGYWCNLPEGEKDKPLKVGDKITLTGKITNYNNTAEIKNGQVAIIERAVEVDLDTISVSDALKRIKEEKTGACFVKGKVMNIDTYNISKGYINYWLADIDNANDSIKAYSMFAAGNVKYTSALDIEFVVGDEVLVYGSELVAYTTGEGEAAVTTPEVSKGYYFRTLKSDYAVTDITWNVGLAIPGEGDWTLDIYADAKMDAKNSIEVVITNAKTNAIAGSYSIKSGYIKQNGEKTEFTEGTIAIAFKDFKDESNIYTVQANFKAAGKIFRINGLVEIAATEDGENLIALVGDQPFRPTEDKQAASCAEARSYTLYLADQTESEYRLAVHGFITKFVDDNTSFWMADAADGGDVMEAYKFKNIIPVTKALAKGAEVIVLGKVKNYKGTPEIVNAKVQVIAGGTDVPVDEEVNVADAAKVAEELGQGKTSTKIYAITGYITAIVDEYDVNNGYMSFWMSDTQGDEAEVFQAYRIYCGAEVAAKLRVGAKVKVTGKVTYFHQNATEGENPKPERNVFETAEGGVVEVLEEAAGVEGIFNNAPAVKFIENGQMFILRNGVRYNLQGQKAE